MIVVPKRFSGEEAAFLRIPRRPRHSHSTKRATVNKREETMSKHDEPTKRHRRPKSGKRIDYTARTMAALRELEKAEKQKTKTA
jgi:hypothetical protein